MEIEVKPMVTEVKANGKITKKQTAEIPTKGGSKYSYQYVDIAQIHDYLEENNMKYYQEIETNPLNGCDYIITYRYIDGEWEKQPKRGCKVVDATLFGNDNPAQKQGSALTYARRYSLLMAFGLATEDDDATSLSQPQQTNQNKTNQNKTIPITEAQIKMIDSLFADDINGLSSYLSKLNKTDVKELTITEASAIIKHKKGV